MTALGINTELDNSACQSKSTVNLSQKGSGSMSSGISHLQSIFAKPPVALPHNSLVEP
jgi:hypothetical protein